jgi:hypothetical protein
MRWRCVVAAQHQRAVDFPSLTVGNQSSSRVLPVLDLFVLYFSRGSEPCRDRTFQRYLNTIVTRLVRLDARIGSLKKNEKKMEGCLRVADEVTASCE